MKTVPSVYTLLMNTIHLSRSAQVAEETVFRKPTVEAYIGEGTGRMTGWLIQKVHNFHDPLEAINGLLQ